MENPKARQASGNQWQLLAMAGGSNGLPPGGTGREATGLPPHEPTLTPTFNAAAQGTQQSSDVDPSKTKKQIEALRKQMSQPRATLEMSPLGSVNRSRNPERDRKLVKTMAALTKQLAEQKKGMKETFALAQKEGQLKQSFSRTSGGMGM